MRNAADNIRPHFDGAPHLRLAVGEGLNTLLWKCDQLQRDLIRKFLSDLEQRPQRRELGVANVDVTADEEDPVRDLPAEHLGNPALDVFDGQVLDPLTPDRDALEERAAEVVPRLANGEDGIEVDVRFDQGGREQAPSSVDDVRGPGRPRSWRRRDPASLDGNGHQALRSGEPGVADHEIGHAGSLKRPLDTRWSTP